MFKIWGHDDTGRNILVFTWIRDKKSGLVRAEYEAKERKICHKNSDELWRFVNFSATRVF